MEFLNTFEYSWIFKAISACFYPPKPLKIAWDGHIFQAEELRLQRLAQQRQAALARRAAAQQRRLGAAAAPGRRRGGAPGAAGATGGAGGAAAGAGGRGAEMGILVVLRIC